MTAIGVIVALIVAVVGVAAGYFIGYNNRKKTAEAQIGSAEAEATRLVNEAIKTADQKRKEAVLEAKDEAFRLKAEVDAQKAEADKEIKQRRAEISRQENRIDQKETALDRKTEALEKKEEELKKRAAEAEERLAEIDALRAKEMERLETLAGLSQEDAREVLLHKVDEELTHEKAVRVAAYETDLKENCDNIARNLIGQAVSRCAADHCSETTVSVVPLPSDEMKGRIIGREGRNIRALETATGVDLIIDDTPEAITLSSFDQTRREVARMTLERLIGDGRIHPARIEETVEKCRHDLELQMKREGERAVMELGIHGLHPDLIKLIGRLKYRTSFGQNALTHSMSSCWPSCWPWMFSSSSPILRSWATVTGRPLTRQRFLPSPVSSRWSSRWPSSSGAAPVSANPARSPGTWENSALTKARSAPVRTRSREVRPPSTAPMASMTMDLPAPVSPVRALKPGRNWMSASWMTAIFSMCRSSSMGLLL